MSTYKTIITNMFSFIVIRIFINKQTFECYDTLFNNGIQCDHDNGHIPFYYSAPFTHISLYIF